jgi:hypothetical protein
MTNLGSLIEESAFFERLYNDRKSLGGPLDLHADGALLTRQKGVYDIALAACIGYNAFKGVDEEERKKAFKCIYLAAKHMLNGLEQLRA